MRLAPYQAACQLALDSHLPPASPFPGKQPRRQRPQPLKHAARPAESRNQNAQQRRADPPDGQRPLVNDRVQVAGPLRVGVATLRARTARRGGLAGRRAIAV